MCIKVYLCYKMAPVVTVSNNGRLCQGHSRTHSIERPPAPRGVNQASGLKPDSMSRADKLEASKVD